MANIDYCSSLASDVKCRYDQKIQIIDHVDSYNLSPDEFSFSVNDLPEVSILDLSEYLTHTHSYYTGLQLKAYKGLLAFKYFEAGAIQSLLAKKINDCFLILSKIRHSQKFREKLLDTWVILLQDRSISSAHCTCMAGLGEVCSHVAIILFYLMSRPKEDQACTSQLALWPIPAIKNVEMARISDMEWSRPRSQDYKKDNVPQMTQGETKEFLRKLLEAGVSPAICRIMEPFASEMAKEEPEELPKSWQNLHDLTLLGKDYTDILKVTENLNLALTKEEILKIEALTRKQSESQMWFTYRAGRITASKFKAVCRTLINKPSLTTIKGICYPEKVNFFSKQTEYGIKNEKNALQAYFNKIKDQHVNLSLKECGFMICKEYVQLGASPDGLISCECCGEGCVEIKCPYLLDGASIEEFTSRKNTCLIKNENQQIKLDKKHSYYYQTQMQMFVTKKLYCEFVIWSKNNIFIERIYYDDEFCMENIAKALKFHKYVVLPEMTARFLK